MSANEAIFFKQSGLFDLMISIGNKILCAHKMLLEIVAASMADRHRVFECNDYHKRFLRSTHIGTLLENKMVNI